MIPAGFEKKNGFIFDDDYYGGEEDDFEFDFGDRKNFNNNEHADKERPKPIENEKNSQFGTKLDAKKKLSNNEDASKKKESEILYKLNTSYYYNDFDYIIDDLKSAILSKNLSLTQTLFEKHNLNVNCKLNTNWIPIMYSVSSGSFEITKLLIEKGANVHFNDDTFSVIMCACGTNDYSAKEENLVKILDLLVERGVDVNLSDKYYQTPLIYASRTGRAKLVDSLVKYKVDINARDDNDWTSLHHASYKGNLKVVQKLLKLGADPLLFTADYLYPFDLAESSGFTSVSLLIKRFIKVQKLEQSDTKINKSSSKSNLLELVLSEFDEDPNEEFNSMIHSNNNKSLNDDDGLETFLSGIKLKNLAKLFKSKDISLKSLLNLSDADLTEIGILDLKIRKVILDEIKKFHKANWKSISLIPVKDNLSINCIEVLSIVANISRCIDFMSTNIKYVASEALDVNKEVFADEHLNLKVAAEVKQAMENTKKLSKQITALSNLIDKKAIKTSAFPIDEIRFSTKKPWYKSRSKLALISSVTICITFTTIFLHSKNL
jgi:ankyrin repeat protein